MTRTKSAPAAPPAASPPVLTSEALFGQGRELVIIHGGQEYRLRITRQNKLILTK